MTRIEGKKLKLCKPTYFVLKVGKQRELLISLWMKRFLMRNMFANPEIHSTEQTIKVFRR
jgi:hypothetical protein